MLIASAYVLHCGSSQPPGLSGFARRLFFWESKAWRTLKTK